MQPYYKNFNKRLIKSPKIYFYDTGIACSLLGLESAEQLSMHFARGALFESFIISEIIKKSLNAGLPINCYFWRDSHGHEIDCILEKATTLIPIEIKSSQTPSSNFFDAYTGIK